MWRRNNGSLEVISGRHRLDLARRSGETTIPAQVYDESQGFDIRRAAALDAELNIRDGQGKVRDYVQFFSNGGISREQADARGLLARATGQRAYAIATGGDTELIAAHSAGRLSDEAAVAISQSAPKDGRLQAVGIKAVADGKSIANATNLMQAVRTLAADGRGADSGDMFGFDDSAMREAEQMAKIATAEQRSIGERLSAIVGAAKRPELARAEGIDVKDPQAVASRIQSLVQARAAWDNWSTNPDLVAQIREKIGNPVGGKKYQQWYVTLTRDGRSVSAIVKVYSDKKITIDVNDFVPGEAGSVVYQMAGDLAHNTGQVFIGDPNGLSPIAQLRRTENMPASALRWGSTDHLAPHELQLKPENQAVHAIRWKTGDTEFNLGEMLQASAANVLAMVPQLDNVKYNFETQQFEAEDENGVPRKYLDSDFKKLAQSAGARAASAGSTTLKRAAFTNSLVQGSRAGNWSEILGHLVRQSGQQLDPQLQRLLYSRAATDGSSQGRNGKRNYYTFDLFGVPSDTRADAPAGRPAAGRDESALSRDDAPGTYAARTGLVKENIRELGADRVTTPQEGKRGASNPAPDAATTADPGQQGITKEEFTAELDRAGLSPLARGNRWALLPGDPWQDRWRCLPSGASNFNRTIFL